MNSQRFVGPNARTVLKNVRATLGHEAVILANRPLPTGEVEMIAVPAEALDRLAAPAPAVVPMAAPVVRAFVPPVVAPTQVMSAAPVAKPAPAPAPVPAAPNLAEEKALLDEIRSMKRSLEQQLAGLAWTESQRRSPLRGELMKSLLQAGFSPLLSRRLLERMPDDFAAEGARDWLVKALAKNLTIASGSLVERGGIYALVGPTGVGKTTTAAKLAAHCVMKFGAAKLGLITTDGYRVGAHDHLRVYGRIIGVPVLVAQDPQELRQAIDSLAGKHLILIDTAGHGQRDERVGQQHDLLSVPGVQRILMLNAAAQPEALDQVARAYSFAGRGAPLAGAILTKLDEAVRLGGALDIALRYRLALQYVTAGQRVPEDLLAPNATLLAHRALREEKPDAAFAMSDDQASLLAS